MAAQENSYRPTSDGIEFTGSNSPAGLGLAHESKHLAHKGKRSKLRAPQRSAIIELILVKGGQGVG